MGYVGYDMNRKRVPCCGALGQESWDSLGLVGSVCLQEKWKSRSNYMGGCVGRVLWRIVGPVRMRGSRLSDKI